MATAPQTYSYVEFAPIVAGAIFACAITSVFLQFGGTLGFTVDRVNYYQGEHFMWRVIVIGLWLLWVQLISSMSGAYIAGRLRAPIAGASAHESEVRDGMHGVLVWATGTLLVVIAIAIGTLASSIAAANGVQAPAEVQVSAEMAKKSTLVLGFLLTASSLVSGVAAWWMGTVGGDHRDTSKDLSALFSFKKK